MCRVVSFCAVLCHFVSLKDRRAILQIVHKRCAKSKDKRAIFQDRRAMFRISERRAICKDRRAIFKNWDRHAICWIGVRMFRIDVRFF